MSLVCSFLSIPILIMGFNGGYFPAICSVCFGILHLSGNRSNHLLFHRFYKCANISAMHAFFYRPNWKFFTMQLFERIFTRDLLLFDQITLKTFRLVFQLWSGMHICMVRVCPKFSYEVMLFFCGDLVSFYYEFPRLLFARVVSIAFIASNSFAKFNTFR